MLNPQMQRLAHLSSRGMHERNSARFEGQRTEDAFMLRDTEEKADKGANTGATISVLVPSQGCRLSSPAVFNVCCCMELRCVI